MQLENIPVTLCFSTLLTLSSWSFHISRCHPLLFYPYHAHEITSKTQKYGLDPHPCVSSSEGMTTMVYCIDNLYCLSQNETKYKKN